MLIKEEICERLSPSYRAEIKRLEKEYAKIADTNLTAKKEYLLQFSQKYLMLPEIWYECFDITDKEQQSCSDLAQLWKDKYNNRKRARKLFFVHKDANYFTKLWHHKVRLDKNFFLDKNDIISILNLPCKGIDQTWIFFDETSR
uniref:Ycf54 n=1 Tax=Panagrolaimus superbus TaxID=310955 RepID=A0A914Z4I1_9BILA